MCEQTEVNYRDGEVVWVKLGPIWWPGRVKDVDELPEEILTSLKKKPIAAVKFFQEDTFEYVRNLNQICRYNCRQKKEFIKKGLDMYRAKTREGSKVMDKFPQDVVTAEEITKGDPNILGQSEFAPEERPDYRNIFGSDKKKEDKKGKHITSPSKDRHYKTQSSANGRHHTEILPLDQPRQAANPYFISKAKTDSEHEIRIRQQPVSTPTRDPNGAPSPQYKCHLCDFTSSRLNVIVLHNKFHSADAANNGQSTPTRTGSAGRGRGVRSAGSAEVKVGGRGRGRGTSSTATPERVRNRSKTAPGTVSNTPKVANMTKEKSIARKRLLDNENKPEEDKSPKETPAIPKTPEKNKVEKPRTAVFGKRKGSKSPEKVAKKKKSDEEIREKLLADWTDEDEEQEEKEIERIKQEISKRESLSSLAASTAEEDSAVSTKSYTPEENPKPKDSSCFDFDDTDDANLGSELEERAKKFVENRKIPRIIDDKSEGLLRRRKIEEPKSADGEIRTFSESVKLPQKDSNEETNLGSITDTTNPDLEEADKVFKNILEETTVPKLPEIPVAPALATTTSSRDTLMDNDDKTNDTEKSITSENVITYKEDVKEEENVSVPLDLDSEETVDIVSDHPDNCKVKEVKDAAPQVFHSDHAEESKSEPETPSSVLSGNREISDEAVSSTTNNVQGNKSISAKEELVTASDKHNDLEVEKAEILSHIEKNDKKADESDKNQIEHEKYIAENRVDVADISEMEIQCTSVSVATDSSESALLEKSLSAEAEIETKSTDDTQMLEKTSDQDELQSENNKIKWEQRGGVEDCTVNICEKVIEKQENKEAAQESLKSGVIEKETSSAPLENTEITEQPISSEQLETKLQTEELSTRMDKEPIVLKEEEQVVVEVKVEDSKPSEVTVAEEKSGNREEEKQDKVDVGLVNQEASSSQMSLDDDEMELDINSMPVVMTDAIITEEPGANKDTNIALPVILQSTSSSLPMMLKDNTSVTPLSTVLCGAVATTSAEAKSTTSPYITSINTNLIKAQPSSIKPVKFQTVTSPSTATLSKVKTSSGTSIISQTGGKLVVIQAPGQKSRYTVGKTTPKKIAIKQEIVPQTVVQQAVGGGKVVILTKPQSGGQQKILTTAIGQQHPRILTTATGGKVQLQMQQRIVASTGAILTPVNPRSVVAKGGKLTPVSQQQIKALQGGKSLGTKFTMQSTQAKVILPSMQKAAVTQSSPMRVIGTLKPQSNTILIQTTQGTAVSSTKTASTAAAVQAKISPAQSVQRPKLLTTASIQRTTLPASGMKTVTQGQPKVVGVRPGVASRMVVQKVQSPGTVSVLPNMSQVRKVSGVFPRTATIQKVSQSTSQTPAVQKIQQAQTVHKVIPLPQLGKKTLLQKISDVKVQVPKANEIVVSAAGAGSLQSVSEASLTLAQSSIHAAQSVTGVSAVQSQSSGIIITATTQSNIISNSSLPVVTTTAASTSVLMPEQIAHVVAATPTEQMGDGGTPTYVLVTIDDSGALQPYDNSSLLAYDGSAQNEATPRTLYIDPSSIGTSGDLENIILTIDNAGAGASTVLNLGQSSTVPVNPVTSIALENQNSSVFNIIPSSQTGDTASTVVSSGGPNQDILAEALANTQVFQPDSSIQDSLTVVNSTPSAVMTSRILEPSSSLHQTTMLLPSLSPVLPPTNPAGVLETSLTLNQPIMTPLEVPSAVTTLQAPPPVPTSLELPLTITQPALSVPSQPFSTLTVPASTPIACISETDTPDAPIAPTPVTVNITESASVPASACNPSMPLLSEETETPKETDGGNDSSTSIASITTASDASHLLQDKIRISYADTPGSVPANTREKLNDIEAFAKKQASQEETYQEQDESMSPVEVNLVTDTPSDANKEISNNTLDNVYQVHDSPSKTKELSISSNKSQVSETILTNNDTLLLTEKIPETSEDHNKEINSSSPAETRPEDKFSDHYSDTLEQRAGTSDAPVTVASFDSVPRNTSSHSENTEKQSSSFSEVVGNPATKLLQSSNYSNEMHAPVIDEGNSSCIQHPTVLSETTESKSDNEQNPHEDVIDVTSPSQAPIDQGGNPHEYKQDPIRESSTTNIMAVSEKQSVIPHSMPLLIDEGEDEVQQESNSIEEEKKPVRKTEGLKRSSPYYNDDDMSNSSSDMDPELKRVRLESER